MKPPSYIALLSLHEKKRHKPLATSGKAASPIIFMGTLQLGERKRKKVSQSLGEISKIDKPVVKLTKKEREDTDYCKKRHNH